MLEAIQGYSKDHVSRELASEVLALLTDGKEKP